jgi:hypothetical protein
MGLAEPGQRGQKKGGHRVPAAKGNNNDIDMDCESIGDGNVDVSNLVNAEKKTKRRKGIECGVNS